MPDATGDVYSFTIGPDDSVSRDRLRAATNLHANDASGCQDSLSMAARVQRLATLISVDYMGDLDMATQILTTMFHRIVVNKASGESVPVLLDSLEAAIRGRTSSTSRCIPITTKSKDGRIFVNLFRPDGKSCKSRIYANDFMCKLFRWPTLIVDNAVKPIERCIMDTSGKLPQYMARQVTCINPFHYEPVGSGDALSGPSSTSSPTSSDADSTAQKLRGRASRPCRMAKSCRGSAGSKPSRRQLTPSKNNGVNAGPDSEDLQDTLLRLCQKWDSVKPDDRTGQVCHWLDSDLFSDGTVAEKLTANTLHLVSHGDTSDGISLPPYLTKAGVDLTALEQDIWSHLAKFRPTEQAERSVSLQSQSVCDLDVTESVQPVELPAIQDDEINSSTTEP